MAFVLKCALVFLVVVFERTLVLASGVGKCPKYNLMRDFNITQFTGHWYEIERSFYFMELTAGCTTIELQENSKGQIEVVARIINRWTGGETKSEGLAITAKRNPAILQYRINSILPTSVAKLLPGAGHYQILYTDYNNVAILWTCSSYTLMHIDQIWILGRKRELTVAQRTEVYDVLSQLNIDSDRLIISKNNNCPEH